MPRYRLGIDVGGTFTDAVLIDEQTMGIVAQKKVLTTHDASEGVARGIVDVLSLALSESGVSPGDVVFIAHGTTQATNALLEGDVAPAGIVGIGPGGVEGYRARADTQLGDIPLSQGLSLRTVSSYLENRDVSDESIRTAIDDLRRRGAQVIVASASFGVDDPTAEVKVTATARSLGFLACAGHDLSKLYGLKVRTRTAAINGSILPVMVRTADMTESAVRRAGPGAPFMVMRSDGGVMDIGEMRKRPLLTMLSGPAAGVAGALMYARLSDGIFLEVGGTSTDISVIRNGQAEVRYAEVGGHRTFLRSLDTRTVGLAGGSMVRIRDGKVIDVGPRSVHIAALRYPVYSDPSEVEDCTLALVSPRPADPPDYVVLGRNGKQILALTLSDVANYLGYVRPEHYAYGNRESAARALEIVGGALGRDPDDLAREIARVACSKIQLVVEELIDEYQLERAHLVLAGGGGGCATVVPSLSKALKLPWHIVDDAQVISTIGVALAAVHDVVERTIFNPTAEDVLMIRAEAEQAAISAGAFPGTVEVKVEVDRQRNIVRASATGATELRTRDPKHDHAREEERVAEASASMQCDPSSVRLEASTGMMYVYQAPVVNKGFLRMLRNTVTRTRVVDHQGVVRLKLENGHVEQTTVAALEEVLNGLLEKLTRYSEGGPMIPETFLLVGGKIVDLSSLVDGKQLTSLALVETGGYQGTTPVVIVMEQR